MWPMQAIFQVDKEMEPCSSRLQLVDALSARERQGGDGVEVRWGVDVWEWLNLAGYLSFLYVLVCSMDGHGNQAGRLCYGLLAPRRSILSTCSGSYQSL